MPQPWGTVTVMDARKQLIHSWLSGQFTIVELSRMYNVSRPTVYTWIKRFSERGLEGLIDHEKARLSQETRTPESIVKKIVEVRNDYPKWGARKILGYLNLRYPDTTWPSDTTIHNILERENLIINRRSRKRVPGRPNKSLAPSNECNQVWCMDFKGWFLTGDGSRFEPFTVTDQYSRYLLSSSILPLNNTENVWGHLCHCFHTYGLPLYIRSDNGAPFASTSVGRLCQLGIKIIKAGVIPELIQPGRPQENGRHERMHRTLQQEIGNPPSYTIEEQLQRLDEFIDYYNDDRPHEALGQIPPSMVYTPSSRVWNGVLKPPEYEKGFRIFKVQSCGKIRYKGTQTYIGRVLTGENIGTKEIENDILEVYYGPLLIGHIHKDKRFRTLSQQRSRRKPKPTNTQESSHDPSNPTGHGEIILNT